MVLIQAGVRWAPWVLAVSALIFSSCSTAGEATPSGFLDTYADLTKGTYFTQEWIASEVDFTNFKDVKVAPVSLSFLDHKTGCSAGELENLAREFRQDIESQLAKKGLAVTSHPGPETLVLSVALTNVEPPNALLNAGLTAATFFAPVPLPFDQDGKTAFEGKIAEGATGKRLVAFTEERSGSGDKISVEAMTVGKYQKFTNSQAVFAGWAETIAEMIADLRSGVNPRDKSQKSKKGMAMTKQIVGMVV